jgi:Fe-S cluster assembly protein SufD
MGPGGRGRVTGSTLPADALREAIAGLPQSGRATLRERGYEAFLASGFPSTRQEDWKYTDLTPVVDISRRWLEAGAPAALPDAESLKTVQRAIDADWIVVANGAVLEDLSPGLSAAGLNRRPIADDLDRERGLDGLNAALARDPLSLVVTADRDPARPVGLLIADSTDSQPASSQVRCRVEIESGASAEFIEYHVSSGEADHYSNTVIALLLNQRSRCNWVRIQDRSLAHSQTTMLDATLRAESALAHFGLDLGGRLTRNDLVVGLEERGAEATFNGVYVVADGQHVDNHTRVDHRVGPARSAQEYRGVLSGRCRAVWNGKAIVYKGADGTDARQANHNLLLSDEAEIDAKPELEIYADDVKAAHGATVGQLDGRALFYLRSRGIGQRQAERMLTRAFAASVVESCPIDALTEMLGQKVETRLRTIDEAARQ